MSRRSLWGAAAAVSLVVVLALLHSAYIRKESVRHWGITGAEPTVLIGGEEIRVALATSSAAREQGLSGSQPLAADAGMLFVFPEDGRYRFWMKDMNYSLDIIWISSRGRIVYIAPSLAPSTYPTSYGPNSASRYVLEVVAGFAQAHGVKVGDHVGL